MCSIKIEEKTDQIINSDSSMIATQSFFDILSRVQSSNLNYQLQMSPYSAVISLKKSLIKDKCGNPVFPQVSRFSSGDDIKVLNDQKRKLESDLSNLYKQFQDLSVEYQNACNTIKVLENHITNEEKVVTSEAAHEVIKKQLVIDEQLMKIGNLEEALKSKDDTLHGLEGTCETARSIAIKLNTELCDIKVKHAEEVEKIKKNFKGETKQWRKELGKVRSENIKLKKRISSIAEAESNAKSIFNQNNRDIDNDDVESFDTTEINTENEKKEICSLCGVFIENYVPKFFLGVPVNPACVKCEDKDDIYDKEYNETPQPKHVLSRRGFTYRPVKPYQTKQSQITKLCLHSKTCIIRQPYPPPIPSLVPLKNEASNYHIKILKGSLNWGGTCGYCFRIDHKNYGCESCVWIKWYGQLHGYPDINPFTYKKYLPD